MTERNFTGIPFPGQSLMRPACPERTPKAAKRPLVRFVRVARLERSSPLHAMAFRWYTASPWRRRVPGMRRQPEGWPSLPGGEEYGWWIGGLPLVSGTQDDGLPHVWWLRQSPGANRGEWIPDAVSYVPRQRGLSVHGVPRDWREAGRAVLRLGRLRLRAPW